MPRVSLSPLKSAPGTIRLLVRGHQIVVWLDLPGRRRKRIGTVNRDLATDARRYRQDLVGKLAETALQEADRRRSMLSNQA